jgi:hypothetical protein
MNIPARYATGYLGADSSPMDFSPWFEGDIGTHFDAQHQRSRLARVLMRRGRHASAVPITAAFGKHPLAKFRDQLPSRTHYSSGGPSFGC